MERYFVEITPNLPFTEYYYKEFHAPFEKTELDRMKKSMAPKCGRKPYFTPEGKVALTFPESISLCMMQYNILEYVKWHESYETIGGVFRNVTHASVEPTVTKKAEAFS